MWKNSKQVYKKKISKHKFSQTHLNDTRSLEKKKFKIMPTMIMAHYQ